MIANYLIETGYISRPSTAEYRHWPYSLYVMNDEVSECLRKYHVERVSIIYDGGSVRS